SERVIKEGLHKGHLRFQLHGKKLTGEFALIRTKQGKENAWLLMKKGADAAVRTWPDEEDRSVLSNRTMDEIAGGIRPGRTDGRTLGINLRGASRSAMPRNIRPMLATPADEPFDHPDWIFEVKWDGYRAIAEIEKGKVRLYSRNKLPFEQRFSPIVDSLQHLGHEAVLDGEVVVLDDKGKPQFQLLQGYQKARQGTLVYQVFDVLYLDGHHLRRLPPL